MKIILAWLFIAVCLVAGGRAAQADCGNVSIAEMSWASAAIAANFDSFILKNGYGCNVRTVAGDTVPTFASMDQKGEPDIAPELWTASVRTQLEAAVKSGRLIQASEILSDGAIEGWWIPKFIADANPDIRSVQDALKRPDLFPAPKNAAKGAVHNCPPGWSCRISTANLFRALNGEKAGFELIDSESPQSLDDSIGAAFDAKVGWLGYYWAPTAILGKYDMTRLSMGVSHDKAEWLACTSVEGCARPQLNAYPVSQAFTVVTKAFADRAGPELAYLRSRTWDNNTINDILAWQDENRESSENAALYFLRNYPELWTRWMPADVAEKVKAAL
ncbi:proline/glycine betaine ABC transporter substrate-binding protein [Rhizobium gallicum]|uniref:Proline/glycine betaine ABC transporter substrate-binding protein n=1 Tax=Rhizobium gallicum TaxID=56730 RepID=A0A1L5NJB6_9HYPH|nr:glycine betaine ABC transporter substrate-binding protein [Rhizobium gallicum]APO68000.1 proline/glycine betaine ABC transporter substrate-binding protein [Rhizobium gallicum]ULJ73043.1 ABC transporter substrate-binding protein [Rhizobium gallicum]